MAEAKVRKTYSRRGKKSNVNLGVTAQFEEILVKPEYPEVKSEDADLDASHEIVQQVHTAKKRGPPKRNNKMTKRNEKAKRGSSKKSMGDLDETDPDPLENVPSTAGIIKQDDTDDIFDETQEKIVTDNVEQIINKIKTEADDIDTINENNSNLMVLISDLPQDDEDIENEIKEDISELSSSEAQEIMSSEESSQDVIATGPMNEMAMPLENIKREIKIEIDQENYQNLLDDMQSENSTQEDSTSGKPPKKKYPFKGPDFRFFKLTGDSLKRKHSATASTASSPVNDMENSLSNEDEETSQAKKGRYEGDVNETDNNILDKNNFELIQKQRRERLNKLNDAIDIIKGILKKLSSQNSNLDKDNAEGKIDIDSETIVGNGDACLLENIKTEEEADEMNENKTEVALEVKDETLLHDVDYQENLDNEGTVSSQ